MQSRPATRIESTTRPRARRRHHADGARKMWLRRSRAVLDLTSARSYDTQAEAAEAIGCSRPLVCYALAGRVATAKSHRLRWLDECPDAHIA